MGSSASAQHAYYVQGTALGLTIGVAFRLSYTICDFLAQRDSCGWAIFKLSACIAVLIYPSLESNRDGQLLLSNSTSSSTVHVLILLFSISTKCTSSRHATKK